MTKENKMSPESLREFTKAILFKEKVNQKEILAVMLMNMMEDIDPMLYYDGINTFISPVDLGPMNLEQINQDMDGVYKLSEFFIKKIKVIRESLKKTKKS